MQRPTRKRGRIDGRDSGGSGRSTCAGSSGSPQPPQATDCQQNQRPASTSCLARCKRRKQSPYIPPLSPRLRLLYNASCFSWWLVVLGLLWGGGHPRTRPYGVPLVFMLSLQSFFSYMGDSYEFLTTGVPGGPWGCADQLWAISTIVLSLLFVAFNNVASRGVVLYAGCLLCGVVCWIAGFITLRIEGGSAVLWAFCHISWHLLLCVGGLAVAFSLEATSIH